ncbi:hypothetical protein I3842_08G003100, partial [Carya illinoinensis]
YYNFHRKEIGTVFKDSDDIIVNIDSFNNFFFPALRRHLAQFIPDFIHKFKNPAEVRLLLFHGFHNTIPKSRLHRFSHFFPAQ